MPPGPPDQRSVLLDLLVGAAQVEPFDLERTLEHLITGAARLVGARYAAIGVVDRDRPGRLALFVHTGMPPDLVRRLGAPPTGRGLLGSLLLRAEPLRLGDLREHPDFTGFPAGHPPMGSFLGVPVTALGEAFGYLYLTEKQTGPEFTPEDEEAAQTLAATTAAHVVRARRVRVEHTRAAWLDATLSVTSTLVGSEDPLEALGTVCARSREVAGADLAWVEVTERSGSTTHTWASSAGGDVRYHRSDRLAASHRVLADRVGLLGTPARGGETGDERLVVVPLGTRSGVTGTLGLAWSPGRADGADDLPTELPASLARQAALALEIAESRRTQRRLATYEERQRIARDLHDITLQQLFAVKLGMESVANRLGEPAPADRLRELAGELQESIVEMRRTIFGLGWQDTAADPVAAVRGVVERAAGVLKITPSMQVHGRLEDLEPDLANDLVAVVAESLSNVARHAGADTAVVDVRVDDMLTVTVTDDGAGMPDTYRAGGLRNLRDRAEAHGGRCTVGAAPGGGTRVTWSVPGPRRPDPG